MYAGRMTNRTPNTYRGYELIGDAPLVDIYRGDEPGVIDSVASVEEAKRMIDSWLDAR